MNKQILQFDDIDKVVISNKISFGKKGVWMLL